MKLAAIDWKAGLSAVLEEIGLMISTVKEKGVPYFLRPLAVAGMMIFAGYYMVYLPPTNKIKRIEKKLVTSRAVARYSGTYTEFHDRLARIYPQLPQAKDRADWLYKTIIDTLKAQNIVSDALRPPIDDDVGGLIYQTTSVSSKLKFNEVYALIERLESVKPSLQITNLEISKVKEDIGYNKVTCSVDTVIPLRRY